MSRAFEKGDSNRCRNVYEQILRAALPPNVLDAQKKNKHVSVGRCRMLAINHCVALPRYEALSKVAFVDALIPREEWSVPTDCKRFLKKLAEEGLCRGLCETCDQLTGDAPPPLLSRSRQSARVTRPPGWDRPHSLPTGAEADDLSTPASSEPPTPAFGPLLDMSVLEDCMQSALMEHAMEHGGQPLTLLHGGETLLHEHGALLESSHAFDEGAALQHGQSARLGSTPARPLCLLSARLAALGRLGTPRGRGPAPGTPATAAASSSEPPPKDVGRRHRLGPCRGHAEVTRP